MSETKEQARPLAPAAAPAVDIDIEEEPDPSSVEFLARTRRNCLKCCGCSVALFLIAAMIGLVLMFTLLRVKDPVLKLNSVHVQGLHVLLNTTANVNLTIEADVSLKNTNVASFRFSNATTDVYYEGSLVGRSWSPAGEAKARRTMRMNVSVDVVMMENNDRLKSDLERGLLPISCYTRISGNVKISDGIRRHVVLRMNCTMNVNVSRQEIQDRNCRRGVHF